jgi:hypothetical protein
MTSDDWSEDDGVSCRSDFYSSCDEDTDLDGWLVDDDDIEYDSTDDSYLDDTEPYKEVGPPIKKRFRRLVLACPDTDDEEPPKKLQCRNRRVILDDEEVAICA